jgi:hypothetical protein
MKHARLTFVAGGSPPESDGSNRICDLVFRNLFILTPRHRMLLMVLNPQWCGLGAGKCSSGNESGECKTHSSRNHVI